MLQVRDGAVYENLFAIGQCTSPSTCECQVRGLKAVDLYPVVLLVSLLLHIIIFSSYSFIFLFFFFSSSSFFLLILRLIILISLVLRLLVLRHLRLILLVPRLLLLFFIFSFFVIYVCMPSPWVEDGGLASLCILSLIAVTHNINSCE